MKLFSSNIIDKPSNPLNQSVSHNHKQGRNPKASVNFQALGQANRQGTKLRSVKSFPIRVGRKQSEGRKSNDWIATESIHLSWRNNHRVGQWQSKMFRIGQPRGKRDAMASLPPPAGFYTGNAKVVNDGKLWITVHNFTATAYSHTPGNISKLVRYSGIAYPLAKRVT